MSRSDLIEIEVMVIHQTAAAVLVTSMDGGDDEVWLPKAACEFEFQHAHNRDGPTGLATLTLSQRYAESKGLA